MLESTECARYDELNSICRSSLLRQVSGSLLVLADLLQNCFPASHREMVGPKIGLAFAPGIDAF